MHWLQTRKFPIFVLFIISTIAASYFLSAGYLTNPYLPKLSSKKSTSLQWKIGTQEYTLPNFIHAGTPNTLTIWCNVSSPSLSVGNPTSIVFVAETTSPIYNIINIEVSAKNALRCEPIAFENFPLMEPPTQSHFSLMQRGTTNNITLSQMWSGGDWVQFQAVGPVELTVTIDLIPTFDLLRAPDSWSEFSAMFPDNDYVLNVLFEPIQIASGEVAVQQESNNLNLSLTYFVLFFASVEIAVAFYDHSEARDKMKEYELERFRKKGFEKTEDYVT